MLIPKLTLYLHYKLTLKIMESIKKIRPKEQKKINAYHEDLITSKSAMLFNYDGSIEQVQANHEGMISNDILEELVEGFIKVTHIGDNYILITNDEGFANGLPYNDDATKIFRSYFALGDDDEFIVGNALIVNNTMID